METKSENGGLLSVLSSNKKSIDEIILRFLPSSSPVPEIKTLYDMMRDYPSRSGKGIRGTMCLLWCELFGGKRDQALVTASALELFQNWILIHDDIEDQSDLRRGLPALHKKFGAEQAINAGDALHGKMWELLISNDRFLSTELTLKILSEFSEMLNETTEGQQMELAWTIGKNWDITERHYLLMVTKKAAWYTCITPCRLGLLLASDSNRSKKPSTTSRDLEKIVKFGTNLGIAFQIVDDLLNLTAEQSKYGKEILGDLFEGKRTLMLIHLLNGMRQDERSEAIKILSKPRHLKTYAEMSGIFEKMKESGSLEYARGIASRHSNEALREFDEIAFEQNKTHRNVYDTTRSLLEYLTSRDY